MPHQNRVTPLGDVVAIPLRGAWMGNRGILHDDGGQVVRHHASDLWITCALAFRGRHITQWRAHHYTVLFFHDEAVSFAAGHRPCAECRRPAYEAYRDAVSEGGKPLSAKEINRQLHGERLLPRSRTRRVHEVPWRELPSGAYVVDRAGPCLVTADALVPWTPEGYAEARPRPRRGTASVLTPPLSLRAMRGGYVPQTAV